MTKLSPFLIEQLTTQVEQCYLIAERRLKQQFSRPTILFNQRGKIAGSAMLQSNTLRFHPLIYQQNKQHFLAHVVPHEIAHLLVWQLHGKTRPHGKEWQTLMTQVFEVPAYTTHRYDVSQLGLTSFLYYCQCGDVELTVRRHNKVLKGAQYRCKACNETLVIKIA